MEAFETFEHCGMVCELHSDYDPMSPADWDNVGTLVLLSPLSRDYNFGRAADSEEEEAADRGGAALLLRYLRMTRGVVALPFYFADHGSSGARLWETDADDESPSGFIYATAKDAERLGVAWEDVPRALSSELATWGAYVEGTVIGYVVKSPSGDVCESVWGFYPDAEGDGYDYVRQEAREAAEREHAEQERAARQDIATL